MQKIFGYYDSRVDIPEHIRKNMRDIFINKHDALAYREHSCGRLFLIYAANPNSASSKYLYNDPSRGITCLVRGNIHAYGQSNPKIIRPDETAKFIYDMYQKEKSWTFVKDLRGIFNIIYFNKTCVFIINDILGLSAMYLHSGSNSCLFSNKAEHIIKLHRGMTIDLTAIASFLCFGFVPDGRTFIESLRNQKEGSLSEISPKGLKHKNYGTPDVVNTSNLPYSEQLNILRKIFLESVKIRAQYNPVVTQLTGGWDTRLILANLIELGIRPVVTTRIKNSKDFQDVVIAKQIARSFDLKHVIRKMPDETDAANSYEADNLGFNAETAYTRPQFNRNESFLKKIGYYRSPIISGNYGTELFGCVPHKFTQRLGNNYHSFCGSFFKKSFLGPLNERDSRNNICDLEKRFRSNNNVSLFLSQIGRTYLSSHYEVGWERPTFDLTSGYLLPFTDTRFVMHLSTQNEDFFNYTGYQDFYFRFYKKFLKYPWTYSYFRKTSLKPATSLIEAKKNTVRYNALNNPLFRDFFKNNGLIGTTDTNAITRLKELYFVFCWLVSFYENLNISQIKFLKIRKEL